MIYDFYTLKNKYSNYSNINQKISLEVKKGNLVRVRRGLYTDDFKIDAPVIANVCYGPSYISFEYALYHYGLIPEYVSVYTSACFNKKNNNTYITQNTIFEYRSIPNDVFYYGIIYEKNEKGISYKIASREKAICDILYSKYPVRSIKDLKILLFEDLRIDENEFYKLDFDFIIEMAPFYHSNSIKTLAKYVREVKKNGNNNWTDS